MLQMRLDKPPRHILRDLHGLRSGSALRNQTWQVRARGQESPFVKRLDAQLQVKLFNSHGRKIEGAETFASTNPAWRQ